MNKIIANSDIADRLKFLVRVSIMVKEGFLSEEDAVAFINEWHGKIVLTHYPK